MFHKGNVEKIQSDWKKTVGNFINSLRFRIIAVIVIVGIIPMLSMEHSVIAAFRDTVLKDKIIDVQGHLSQTAGKIGLKTTYIDDKTEIYKSELDFLSDIFDGRILVVNNQMKIIYDTYVFEEGKTLISDTVIECLSGQSGAKSRFSNGIYELSVPIHDKDGAVEGLIVFNVSESEFVMALKGTVGELYVIRILLIIAVIIIAVCASSILVVPIEALTASIKRFAQGYYEHVNEKGYSEIAELSGAFNKLFGRMARLDESRQEFVSNVSHELKTPMTSMKVLADTLNNQPDAPLEMYKEFMSDIAVEIDRENRIINDLLTLVSMDKTEVSLNLKRVNINELVELVLKRISPIASKKNIEIIYESFRSVTADVDEVKLSLAITNLVENAVKYNRNDGWVRVSLNADYKYFYIQVEDNGIGIPKEHQDKIFERFYRVDKTRSRKTGGTGLGLAITRDAVTMHNGSIKLESTEGKGSRFIVRIPLGHPGGDRN